VSERPTLRTALAKAVPFATADGGEVMLHPLTFDDWAEFEAWVQEHTPKGESVVGRLGESLGSIRGMRRLVWISLGKSMPGLSIEDVWPMFGGTLSGLMAAHAELMRLSGFDAQPEAVEEPKPANPPQPDDASERPSEVGDASHASHAGASSLRHFGDSQATPGPIS